MGDGGAEPHGDARGTETSVSHEVCGAALAFTGCVIFLQAFHNVNTELFFAKIWDWGSRSLACTNTQKATWKLSSSTAAQRWTTKGQQKDGDGWRHTVRSDEAEMGLSCLS